MNRRQLIEGGLTNQQLHRRAAKGILIRVLPGVYRHASVPESWIQRVWAAYLWAGDGAAVSHQAAGALWELDGCAPGAVTLLTTRGVKRTSEGFEIHRVAEIPSHHLTHRDGLMVTTPTRTIMDLAAVVAEADLEAALDCALRRGSVSLARLQAELGRSSGRGQRGRSALTRLLRERTADYSPTHSVLETRFRQLLKRNRLPLPAQQHTIRRQRAGFARVDFVYPEHRLVIEVDGFAWHGSRQSWQQDLLRQNDLVAAGFKVLRYTWRDISTEGAAVVETLRSFFLPTLPLDEGRKDRTGELSDVHGRQAGLGGRTLSAGDR